MSCSAPTTILRHWRRIAITWAGMAIDWDLGDAAVVERVAEILVDNRIDVLAGGPPCQPFSKAGRSGMRFLVREGLREPHDRRRDLWRSYLEVVRLATTSRGDHGERPRHGAGPRDVHPPQHGLRAGVARLLRSGASGRRLAIRRSAVPPAAHPGGAQGRRRVRVAGRDAAQGHRQERDLRPAARRGRVATRRAARRAGSTTEGRGPRSSEPCAQACRSLTRDKVFDHITRPVREDDERAFELLDSESRYSDLPDHLKRYRDDIFDDKYKRLSGDDVSRTITAHIAKDGYWYIHPEQNRTLTVREAARIQTFPDWFRFAGPPSAAFKQIGNAVPPRLGFAIGSAVVGALSDADERPAVQRGDRWCPGSLVP